jgi:hypothetical protein
MRDVGGRYVSWVSHKYKFAWKAILETVFSRNCNSYSRLTVVIYYV